MTDWARPELLATTAWLAEHLDDPAVVVVDCDEPAAYFRLHIPGAVRARSRYWKGLGTDTDTDGMDDPTVFAEHMRQMGIGNDSLVVAYDGAGGLYAARFWWTLDRFGFTNCKVLDGGLDAWHAEGRPLERTPAHPAPGAFTAQPPHDRWLCRIDEVARAHEDPGHVLWDVRSDAEWSGANKRGTQRGGRIPGAVHWEWTQTLEQPVRRLRAPDALRADLANLGITPDKAVTTY